MQWKWKEVKHDLQGHTDWEIVSKRAEEKGFGIVMQDSLSPAVHIDKKIGDTCRMLRSMRVAFTA